LSCSVPKPTGAIGFAVDERFAGAQLATAETLRSEAMLEHGIACNTAGGSLMPAGPGGLRTLNDRRGRIGP
jgi:hypothetical protein